jgi:predicted heme/steroid binding protein
MRNISQEELAACNGQDGAPAWVAHQGLVYDVSGSYQWRHGRHQVTTLAGRDYTESLNGAPHGPHLLERFPVVGRLSETRD